MEPSEVVKRTLTLFKASGLSQLELLGIVGLLGRSIEDNIIGSAEEAEFDDEPDNGGVQAS